MFEVTEAIRLEFFNSVPVNSESQLAVTEELTTDACEMQCPTNDSSYEPGHAYLVAKCDV